MSDTRPQRSPAGPATTTAPSGPPARGPAAAMFAGMPAEKALEFGPSARRLLRRMSPDRLLVLVVLAATVVSVALNVIGPKLLGDATNLIFAGVVGQQFPAGATRDQVIDQVAANGDNGLASMLGGVAFTPGQGVDFTAVAHVLALAAVLYALASVFQWLQAFVLNGIVQRTVRQLRDDVEAKLHRLPLSYFDSRSRGEVLSRVTNDIDNVGQSLQQSMSQLLTSVLTVIGVLTAMLLISPLLAIVAVVMIPLSIVLTRAIAKRSQPLFVAQWSHTGRLNGHIEETYTGHALVKVFGHQGDAEAEFDARNGELYRTSFGAQFLSGVIMPTMMFLGNLTYVLIAVVGGLQVASGSMSLGSVQAFIQYSRQFTQPLTQLASMANIVQSGVASAERVFELLDTDEQRPEVDAAGPAGPAHGRVEFEHVSFRYLPDTPLIDDLSLVAEPGHTVAIVGPTGAGKTTLVNLVMRFYELDAGRITLDGRDIALIPRDELRKNIGMVLQDTWLFHGTIEENIRYGRPSATAEEVRAAARATFVDRFVQTLPDGYATVIDEEGGNVSAGERQLITIARAFLAAPSLLILDEATSSVDTRTEALLQRAMSALRTDRTSFVIAHRLSTIRDADLILVMADGRIVEQGSHGQLLEQNGTYAALYEAQFAGATAAADA
ncbi:MAG: ABC transporter ATP-binding protein [Actinomycetota bacterium]|nr:MAG: ABC transporter ATP-binding protein [Actinomycetota bacterium]